MHSDMKPVLSMPLPCITHFIQLTVSQTDTLHPAGLYPCSTMGQATSGIHLSCLPPITACPHRSVNPSRTLANPLLAPCLNLLACRRQPARRWAARWAPSASRRSWQAAAVPPHSVPQRRQGCERNVRRIPRRDVGPPQGLKAYLCPHLLPPSWGLIMRPVAVWPRRRCGPRFATGFTAAASCGVFSGTRREGGLTAGA